MAVDSDSTEGEGEIMNTNPMDLTGKRILVTGASSGIGQATSLLISRMGGKVVMAARDEKRLKEVYNSLDGQGHAYYIFDLTDLENIPGFIRKIASEQGRLSGLFHSAGVTSVLSINVLKPKMIEDIFSINIKTFLLLVKGYLQKDVKDDGITSIVVMSSVAGICGISGMSVYSASKAAVNGAVKSLACELAAKRVRVNSIIAGAVRTKMLDEYNEKYFSEVERKAYESKHVLGFGEAEDVANAAVFLLSDASKWITGTTLIVDGGYSCP